MYELDLREEKTMPCIRYGFREYGASLENGVCWLPIPSGLSTSEGGNWEEKTFGGLGAIKAHADALLNVVSGIDTGNLKDLGASVIKAATSDEVKGAGKAIGRKLAAASNLALPLNRGRADNTMQEQWWTGMGFRTFTFTHTLNPDSAEDTDKIKNILQYFREFSAPELVNMNTQFKWPGDVWPKFYSGEMETIGFFGATRNVMVENEYLPKLQRCLIKSVAINYQPQEPYQQHAGGAPTSVELAVELEEIVLQHKEVIRKPRTWGNKYRKIGEKRKEGWLVK